MISEKPSVARALAAVVGANEKQDGYLQGNGYIVTWCLGHLVEMAKADAYDARYSKWRREDLPIIPAKFRSSVPKDKAKQLKVIAGLMARPDVDIVVCATDAGREGELIFRLVYDYCKSTKPIQRLWISSMEECAISQGFAGLRPGAEYENLYNAALCRARADWIVGINATRLFSTLYGPTLNVGRVQTPTLALLVERGAAIEGFTPQAFYNVLLDLGTFSAKSEKLDDKAAADAMCAACSTQAATVDEVKREAKTAEPPKLYDLTTLQRVANRLHGFTAQQTLDYTQSLYEKRLVTYPRTESQYLTADMGATAGAIVNYLQVNSPFSAGAGYTPDIGWVTDDARVSDHHAIIPTMELARVDYGALPAGEKAVLDMVCARLLCATAPPHKYESITATVLCGGFSFSAAGKTILVDGWKTIEAAHKAQLGKTAKEQAEDAGTQEDGPLPQLEQGQVFENVQAEVKEGKTAAPKPYTEDTLLAAMEKAGQRDAAPNSGCAGYAPEVSAHKGLGTPATRAGIIEKLVRGGFIERKKRQLLASRKGINLVAVLPDVVKSPALTAEWETKLLQIEHGALAPETFMQGIAGLTTGLVNDNGAPLEQYRALFASPPGDMVGVCPRCGKEVREFRKGFFCADRACGFGLWKNDRFFTGKGKELTKATAAALLKNGRAEVSCFISKKTGKPYAATVVLEDTGRYVNFMLEFPGSKGAKGGK